MLKILEDALSIKFESHLGSDFSDAESIYDQWHEKRFLIPSNLHILDKAMAGGFEPTNLYIFIANVGVGKSTLLVDLASRILRQKRNVLFVSLELSEIKIQERVIANLMNMNVNDLKNAERNPKNRFIEKMNHIKNGIGNFNVLYDSSGNCDVLHIKKIMADIKRNTGFKPDVIIIDHLSNLRSVALKRNQNVRGDEILESVSSEVKNMAGELGISVITAEQTRREARDKLFPGLEDIAGSHGISKKADFICSIGEDEQLIDEQMWQMNICKTRFSGMVNFRFKIKVNKDIQKTFDIITDGSGKETSQAPEEHETPTFTPESIKPNYRSAMPRRKRVISTSV
jgi:replicative DNA helicase